MTPDYRDLKAYVEEQMSKKREDFIAYELLAHSALDRWWGVPGISKPLGLPEDLSDDSLLSLAKTYRRGLEDVRDGLATRAQPDLTVEQTEENLRAIEEEQECRRILRELWKAREHGTNDYGLFRFAGGLDAIVNRSGKAGLHPSYKLALFMDYRNWLSHEPCCFEWSTTCSEIDRDVVWASKAENDEYRAYKLWERESAASQNSLFGELVG